MVYLKISFFNQIVDDLTTKLVFQLNIFMMTINKRNSLARTMATMNFIKEFYDSGSLLCDLGPRMAQEVIYSRISLTPHLPFCFLHTFTFKALTAKLSLMAFLWKRSFREIINHINNSMI